MRHRLHILFAIMSCCFLLLTQSCSQDADNNQEGGTDKDPQGKTNTVVTITEPGGGGSDKTLPIDQAPLIPVPAVPGPALIPPPPGDAGLGGGSQGAQKPGRTGNPDEDPEPGPNGICGNGIQEVLPDNPACIYDIYGATTNGVDGESRLIGFDLTQEGVGYDLGAIPTIHRVSALDFAPDGTLYAVGENEEDVSVFAIIDCQTPHTVTIVGPTGIEGLSMGTEVVTDIDFDSNGRLFAYVELSAGADQVGLIDPASGDYETLGPSGLDDIGNGLGSIPFPADTLYQAGNDNINIINKLTGAATPGMNIGFIPPADDNNPRVNALDADYFTNLMYASIADAAAENFLTLLNVLSGVVTYLAAIPEEAPNGLDAIAVNRRYEECDPLASEPALPIGTSCTEDCELIESNCEDGIDNDQDTLIDCDDPDCLNQPCNDENGCTLEDTCVFDGGETDCVGTRVDCEELIANECSMDICFSISSEIGDENFKCNSMLVVPGGEDPIFGVCTPFGNCEGDEEDFPENRNDDGSCDPEDVINDCIVGQCVSIIEGEDPPSFECDGEAKQEVPIEDGGCLDDNPCTADGCEIDEDDEDGDCTYSILDNVFCENDNNLCTVDLCNVGVCEFVIFANDGTTCDDGNPCTDDDSCNTVGDCDGTNDNTNECDDGNDCTVDDGCDNLGDCTISTDVSNTCEEDADCANGRPCIGAIAGTCSITTTTLCFDDEDCPGDEICNGEVLGQCGCNGDGSDDFTCNLGVCVDGTCDTDPIIPVDELCETIDDVCTTQECTETGCKTTLMDGPMICPIELADLSEDFSILLSGLGLSELTCDFGILLCIDGEQEGECELTEDLFEPCTEASLEADCTDGGDPAVISALAAAAICAQLPLELLPPPEQ